MDVTELLKNRASAPWRILGEPGPSDEELREFLEAAVTAPDHGAVRPWRFIVVRGGAREALGELFTEALLKRKPDADEATIEKDRDRMRQVPLLIVVAARITQTIRRCRRPNSLSPPALPRRPSCWPPSRRAMAGSC